MKRIVLSVAVVALVLTALVGVAHTGAGRPLLAWMGRASAQKAGCPLGFDRARSPEQKVAARRQFARAHGGAATAGGRPALGFALGGSTRGDVQAWAAAHGVRCVVPRSGGDLECSGVAEALLPEAFRGAAIDTLWIEFGADERLVSVVAVRRDARADRISAAFAAVAGEVARSAGAPSGREGDARPAELARGALRQASVEYRFRDYYALARATNMGDGYVLTEEYRALVD